MNEPNCEEDAAASAMVSDLVVSPSNEENQLCEETVCEDRCPTQESYDPPAAPSTCEMCHNYEINLTKLQDRERGLKEKLAAAQHLADRYQTELSGERVYRNELESKMGALSTEADQKYKNCLSLNELLEVRLKTLEERHDMLKQEKFKELEVIQNRCSDLENGMKNLIRKYMKLLGLHKKSASEMREQEIELPQEVDQLQFMCLKLREDLIETVAAREYSEGCLKDEITMLEEQRKEDQLQKERSDRIFAEQYDRICEDLAVTRSQMSSLQDDSRRLEEMEKVLLESRNTIEDLENQIYSLKKEKSELEMTLDVYRQRCSALQQELDTSETVQKDFVKLSQNLQIELEKIRQAEQEARWQFDEDVHECNQCKCQFVKSRSKFHCQHCGRIFCANCLNCTVRTGPHARLAKVCQVCHTLLSRDTAPFFSHSTLDS